MIALDTSVIVAGLLAWHERHPPCLDALQEALALASPVILPLPALVESYSVLTRLPAPHRLSPASAFTLLEDTFHATAEVAGVEGEVLWTELSTWCDAGVAGGRAYDAHIMACARRAGSTRLLTLNPSHFAPLAGPDIEVAVPGGEQ